MLDIFKPTWMVESIYNITPEQLKKLGIKMVLTDLDNTLIAWNNPEATEQTIEWLKWMKQEQIEVIIVSNNSEKRVKAVASILKIEFVSRALKPTSFGFRRIFKSSEYTKEEALMIGDQVLTDIIGANSAGLKSVLVKPIMNSDAWNTKINRFIELKIMNHMVKKDPEMKWSRTLNETNQK